MNDHPNSEKIEKALVYANAGAFWGLTLAVVIPSGGLGSTTPFIEDGLLEWLQGAFLLIAVVLSLVTFRKASRHKSPWRFILLFFAAFCLWVFLEEISYGQRIIGFDPPYWFIRNNAHREVNLHNLPTLDKASETGVMAITILWGLILPITTLAWPSIRNWTQKRFIPVPSTAGMTGCALGLGMEIYARNFCPGYWPMSNEILEGYLYMTFALASLETLLLINQKSSQ